MGQFKMKPFYLLVIIAVEFAMGLDSTLNVQPEEYDIFIKTQAKDFEDNKDNDDLRFSGKVAIKFKYVGSINTSVNFSINVIPETKIQSVELMAMNKSQEESVNVKYSQKEGLLFVTVEKLPVYEFYAVLINFTNPYQKDMTGFYRSYYRTPDNTTRWLVTTHFEPTYARSAFPCFDNPSLKAFFTLRIAYPKSLTGYNVLCNTPVLDVIEEEGGYKVATCKPTLTKMSTYLVAFAISDFEKTKSIIFKSDYPKSLPAERKLTTYGRKTIINANEGQLSLDVGVESLRLLSEYLNKGYAFEKVDFIGIPDFSVGAMENWGLITYREQILFFNETSGSAASKQGSALTIVHELVHQWFGNLVTLNSWNYIWLNEAFATYISYVIANKIEKPSTADWGYMKQILFKEVHLRAFETDGLPAAKPLTQDHEDENLVSAAFDDIPYAKGASILRMWDLTLPKDKFRKSLVDYIEVNQEKNVEPRHLYESFKKVANMEEDFFKSWNENPGYPVISVKKVGSVYKLSQSRFFWEKPNKTLEDTKYVVPITYTEADGKLDFDTVPKLWLRNEDLELKVTGKWFLINNQQAGYYRVNYEKENWLALAAVLHSEQRESIHELNRAQIINDIYSLARSVHKDYIDYDTALNLSMFLKNEDSYVVWKSAFNAFDFLLSKVSQEQEISDRLKEYILELVKPHFKPLDEIGEKHLNRLMRTDMARWACALNYEPCLKNAKELYSKARNYPDVEEVILCNAVKVDDKLWDEIFKMYLTELDSSKKIMYLSSLGCTHNEKIIESYLEMTISKNLTIRLQDRSLAMASIYRGDSKNVETAFRFIEKNFVAIANQFGGVNPLGKVLTGIARNLHSENDIERMKVLTKKVQQIDGLNVPPSSLDNAVSIVASNQQWLRERAQFIRNYLNSSSSISYSILLVLLSIIFTNQL